MLADMEVRFSSEQSPCRRQWHVQATRHCERDWRHGWGRKSQSAFEPIGGLNSSASQHASMSRGSSASAENHLRNPTLLAAWTSTCLPKVETASPPWLAPTMLKGETGPIRRSHHQCRCRGM